MTSQTSTDLATLLLRLSMGTMLLAHSLILKVMTYTVAGTAGWFASLGYPSYFAHIVIVAEILAGLAFLLGVHSRWAALALIPIMVGATLQHMSNGWFFASTGGGWEFPALWTILLVVQALLGDGRFRLPGIPKFYGSAWQSLVR